MKILPMTAELFHADRRTDVTKLIVAFRNFCERAWKAAADFFKFDYKRRIPKSCQIQTET